MSEGRLNVRHPVSSRGTFLTLGLHIAWAALILWSFASLFFYRSSAGHGPDMVGEIEVTVYSAFVVG